MASEEEEGSGGIDSPTAIDLPVAKRKRSSRASKHPAFDRVKAIWNDKLVPHLHEQGHQIPSHPSLSHTTGLGQSVNRWLHERDDAEGTDLRKLIAWLASSKHHRARYLRENGHGLSTLIRPSHYDDYVGFAHLHAKEDSKPERVNPMYHPYSGLIRKLIDNDPDPSVRGLAIEPDDIESAIGKWGEPTPENVAAAWKDARARGLIPPGGER